MTEAPVEAIPTDADERKAEEGAALCLSGGGYRAMVFHIGVLWRLYEARLLGGIKRISSVSGGSITAGLLGLKWGELSFDPDNLKSDFVWKIVRPLRAMASKTVDVNAVVVGSLLPGRISDRVSGAYDAMLFHGATLQDLPDEPRFVINATNVQSCVLWRFMKPYMRDYRVGEIKKPGVPLAQAVAASSAFPPFLSPFELRLNPDTFTPKSGLDLQQRPFTSRVILTDGGVYDNLGLETAWKRYQTIFVSDAGGKTQAEAEPKTDWGRHSYRVFNLVDNQVRSLRKRQVIESFKSGVRNGAYWGIRTNINDYGLPNSLNCPFERTLALAETPTRLKALEDRLQNRLINWGYAVCDAALRRHVDTEIPKGEFPYPGGV
jgi:Predicted esterase of the alpha-beta hydrolase superfamily